MEYRSNHKYPTTFLQPTAQSRLVREVVWVEVEYIDSFRPQPDMAATLYNIHRSFLIFRRLKYNVPELLSVYQHLAPSGSKVHVTPDTIPWELVPEDMLARCLDENYELQVTPELLKFLNFDDGTDSVFNKYEYNDRKFDKNDRKLIRVKCLTSNKSPHSYMFYDEEKGEYTQAIVGKSLSKARTHKEIDFVVENFKSSGVNSMGISNKLLEQTLMSMQRCVVATRKEFFATSYLERIKYNSVEEIRQQRLELEKECAISRHGDFKEDTTRLWRF